MSKIIGIDLGTTNCCVSVLENNTAQIIPNREGSRTTPSVVGFTEKGEKLIGQIAKRQAVTNPKNTVYAVKRLIGRKYDSPEVKRMEENTSFQITEAVNGDAHIEINNRDYSPQEVSALILQRLKQSAEAFLADDVTKAIITVPAYFDDAQRQATRDAGKIAGLEVERIINEPTAAALAYGFGRSKSETIAVYDFGGGTFDITILEINEGVFEILSTSGNTFLGGEDFDQKIIDWIIEEFRAENGIDLKIDKLALQRLKEAAERAKCELSTVSETNINLPFIAADQTGTKHINLTITRSKFEELVADLVDMTVEPCQRAVKDANLKFSDIDKIILVGGQTRSPIIHKSVKQLFGKEPSSEINPDEVVAMGAAIQGGVLGGDVKDIILLDVLPLSLGLETRGGIFVKLIPRSSTIPLKNSMVFTTVVDNQNSVEIHILQGERELASGNRSLGKFELIGLPPGPRGSVQIEVVFEVDVNGILDVSAKDKATGLEQAMKITPTSGLAPEEIERLIIESKREAERDEQQKLLIIERNQLESLIKSTRRAVSEIGRSLDSAEEEQMNAILFEAEEKVVSEDIEEIREATEKVETIASEITKVMMTEI